jgi:hypothetical protein
MPGGKAAPTVIDNDGGATVSENNWDAWLPDESETWIEKL